MDRTKLKLLGIIVILGVGQTLWAMPATAGAVLVNSFPATDPNEPGPDGEAYPQSRFGHAPEKPSLGVATPGYASKASDEMDNPSADGVAPSRSPAGLVFGNAPVTQHGVPAAATQTRSTAAHANYDGKGISGVQEVALIASDLGFFPKTVFVSRDVPVRMYITGSSKNTLCIMMDSFQVRKQVRSQKIEEISFTPNMPGQYRFYCPVNGAEGSLIVKELSSNISIPPTGSSGAVSQDSGTQQASAR